MHTMQNTKKGFTLIELLIVITIIGILAAALLPQVLGAPARARDAARIADLNQIVTALETYATDNDGLYPSSVDVGCLPTVGVLDQYFQGGEVPTDTQGLATSGCSPTASESTYFYCTATGSNNYILAAAVEIPDAQGNYDSATALDCTGEPIAPPALTPGTGDTYIVVK